MDKKLSRKEALRIISAGMSLPFLVSMSKNGYAAPDGKAAAGDASAEDKNQTAFVDDYVPGHDARVELRNGKIVDVIEGRYFETGTSIVIKGGRIAAILKPAQDLVTGAPADFIVDLKGRAVLPTLFNTHCHIGMTFPSRLMSLHDMGLTRKHHEEQIAKNMTACLIHGITNIRDAWIPDLRTTRALKEKISKGRMKGPRILQSVVVGPPGGYLTEDVGFIDRFMQSLISFPFVDYEEADSGVVLFPVGADEQQVRDAVDKAIDERGAECIKVGEQRENMADYQPDATIMTKNQLTAVAEQARRRGLKSTMHHVSVESFRRGVECGISSLAHAAFDERLPEADGEAFIASGCVIEPTASVAYNLCWKIKGDPFYGHTEMERLSKFRAKNYSGLADEYWIAELSESAKSTYDKIGEGRLKSLGLFDLAEFFRYFSPIVANGVENLRMLFDGGATMAAGNDGGVPLGTPAMMAHELSMLDYVMNSDSDKRRLQCADAVKIATINSAQAIGLENDFGSTETGKIADLAIVDGDPLEDITVIGSRVAALFMDGKLTINNCELDVMPGAESLAEVSMK